MPIYEYVCKNCDLSFEKLLKISELDKNVKCPKCSSYKTERKVSAFSTKNRDSNIDSSCGNSGFG